MSNCQFNTDGPPWTCSVCGFTYTRQTVDGKPPRKPDCGAAKPKGINPETLKPAAAKLGITLADARHYAVALARWTAAGFPVRSQAEVLRIAPICQACGEYADGRCRKCGCRVNASRVAVANKAKMATEHCPLGKW